MSAAATRERATHLHDLELEGFCVSDSQGEFEGLRFLESDNVRVVVTLAESVTVANSSLGDRMRVTDPLCVSLPRSDEVSDLTLVMVTTSV